MKPLIGITGHVEREPENPRSRGHVRINWNYLAAVREAGGSPFIIPPQADALAIAAVIDGLLIPGGPDIDAAEFGEVNHPSVKPVDPERYRIEKEIFQAIDPAMPVLGICYGCQFINVQHGGGLIQHLPDVVGHEHDIHGESQAYGIDKESCLGGIVGENAHGQSWHHQAVGNVGAGLMATAKNEDGIVEAPESTERAWMIGVQWHPERTATEPDSAALFRAFVEAAKSYAKSKLTLV